jgi:hypothetical protein
MQAAVAESEGETRPFVYRRPLPEAAQAVKRAETVA